MSEAFLTPSNTSPSLPPSSKSSTMQAESFPSFPSFPSLVFSQGTYSTSSSQKSPRSERTTTRTSNPQPGAKSTTDIHYGLNHGDGLAEQFYALALEHNMLELEIKSLRSELDKVKRDRYVLEASFLELQRRLSALELQQLDVADAKRDEERLKLRSESRLSSNTFRKASKDSLPPIPRPLPPTPLIRSQEQLSSKSANIPDRILAQGFAALNAAAMSIYSPLLGKESNQAPLPTPQSSATLPPIPLPLKPTSTTKPFTPYRSQSVAVAATPDRSLQSILGLKYLPVTQGAAERHSNAAPVPLGPRLRSTPLPTRSSSVATKPKKHVLTPIVPTSKYTLIPVQRSTPASLSTPSSSASRANRAKSALPSTKRNTLFTSFTSIADAEIRNIKQEHRSFHLVDAGTTASPVLRSNLSQVFTEPSPSYRRLSLPRTMRSTTTLNTVSSNSVQSDAPSITEETEDDVPNALQLGLKGTPTKTLRRTSQSISPPHQQKYRRSMSPSPSPHSSPLTLPSPSFSYLPDIPSLPGSPYSLSHSISRHTPRSPAVKEEPVPANEEPEEEISFDVEAKSVLDDKEYNILVNTVRNYDITLISKDILLTRALHIFEAPARKDIVPSQRDKRNRVWERFARLVGELDDEKVEE